MVKKKSLIIGALVLAALIVVYFVIRNLPSDSTSTTQNLITGMTTDNISAISYVCTEDGSTISFEKNADGEWVNSVDPDFETDQSEVDGLSAVVLGAKVYDTVTDPEDPAEYGLDAPVSTITLTDKDGNKTVINLGSKNSLTYKMYVTLGDDTKTVYVTDYSLLTYAGYTLDEYEKASDSTATDGDVTETATDGDVSDSEADETSESSAA